MLQESYVYAINLSIGAILAAQTLAVEEALVEYGKNIGLAYVPDAMSAIGTAITVRDPERGRTAPAVIVKTPFYKRAK